MIMKTFFVYMVRCRDEKYYVGITNDVDRRLVEHNLGLNPHCYTYFRRPVSLVFTTGYRNVAEAIAFEKQLKGWSRAKKESLITGDWARIKELARGDKRQAHPSTSSG